ncbi:MAG TPA: hypothetical protein DET40_05320 [Lentisphaeria bacterium]|nr:MAG: hypothetical protein A2X45_21915 [Lentisphaerae bacterium GWF2_50_93]HCE42947.1 hypothetical protein [Lentisphaeria bacterium]
MHTKNNNFPSYYRPLERRREVLPLPVSAIGCGSFILQKDDGWKSEVPPRPLLELFWGVTGNGTFVIEDKEHLLRPGEICFYLPGDVHRISYRRLPWECMWMTVSGPLLNEMIEVMGIRREPRFVGECPQSLFEKLAMEIQMPDRQRLASSLAYEILVMATDPATSRRQEPVLAHRCIECMTENFSDPSFNINRLAKILNVNRNHLSRSFSEAREVTLTRYLQTLRFQKALSLLRKTSLPVAQIAEDCGFASASYLAHCLQKEMGISASEFRKGKEPRF